MTTDNIKHTELAPSWHSWGSPVGLGVFLVSLGALLTGLAIATTLFANLPQS